MPPTPPQGLHYTPGPTDEDIMADMQTHGPQATCFKVYDDFLRYTGGVYTLTEGSPYIGGHCVRLLGWGVSLETEASSTGANKAVEKSYWLAANEWGTTWGEGGFFRIARGTNGVEFAGAMGIAAGIPDYKDAETTTPRTASASASAVSPAFTPASTPAIALSSTAMAASIVAPDPMPSNPQELVSQGSQLILQKQFAKAVAYFVRSNKP